MMLRMIYYKCKKGPHQSGGAFGVSGTICDADRPEGLQVSNKRQGGA